VAVADFIKDSKATVGFRNYYLNNDYRSSTGPAGRSKTAEWAQGFFLDYRSGFSEADLSN
jgi:hypothetical protein